MERRRRRDEAGPRVSECRPTLADHLVSDLHTLYTSTICLLWVRVEDKLKMGEIFGLNGCIYNVSIFTSREREETE